MKAGVLGYEATGERELIAEHCKGLGGARWFWLKLGSLGGAAPNNTEEEKWTGVKAWEATSRRSSADKATPAGLPAAAVSVGVVEKARS